MKAKKLFFMECNLAGRQYHDVDEVWDELHVGTRLELQRDLDNRYDKNAVAVVYHNTDEKSEETEESITDGSDRRKEGWTDGNRQWNTVQFSSI